MGCCRRPDNGQPQPRTPSSAAAGRIPPVEWLKQVGQLPGGETGAVVVHRQAEPAAYPFQPHRHRAPLRRIPQGIGGQVFHRALQPCPVAEYLSRLQIQLQVEPLSLQWEGQPVKDRPHQGVHRQHLPVQRPALLHAGELQRAAHQSGHAVALVQHHIQVFPPPGRGNVLPQRLRVGAEHRKGGLQLMGRRPGEGPFPLQRFPLAAVRKDGHAHRCQQREHCCGPLPPQGYTQRIAGICGGDDDLPITHGGALTAVRRYGNTARCGGVAAQQRIQACLCRPEGL